MLKSIATSLLLLLMLASCNSNSGDVHVRKAINFYENDVLEDAEKELKTALTKELHTYPKQEVLTMLGNVYTDLDKFDEAINYHKQALDLEPDYADALVNLGIVYRLTEEYDLAEECYMKAKEITPNNAELYASLGSLSVYQGNLEQAVEYLERAIKLDPGLAITHSNYAMALAMTGEHEKAQESLDKAIELGYKNGDIVQEELDYYKNYEEFEDEEVYD